MAEAEMAVAEMAAAVTAAEMAAAVTAEAATAAARKILLLVNICCSKMAVTAEAAAMAAAVKINKGMLVGGWVGGWMGGVWVNAPATCGSSKNKKVSNRGGGCAAGVLEGGEGRGGNGGQLTF